MIKVLPQGICTEGLDGRPESKQTGKGEARTKSVLISATPIKCCRFEREKKKTTRRAGDARKTREPHCSCLIASCKQRR